MAKIEMDLSEYERIQENKRLLEDSLKNERNLKEEITKLQKEKIQALEDAKMKVIKIKKKESTEHLITHYDTDYEVNKILVRLKQLVYTSSNHIYEKNILYDLYDILFKKTTTCIIDDEITTHGLDEIKSELRIDIEKGINDDIKNKLKDAEKFQEEKYSILEKLSKSNKENSSLNIEIENLLNVIKISQDKLDISDAKLKELTGKFDNIRNIILSFNRLNSYWKLRKIRDILDMGKK